MIAHAAYMYLDVEVKLSNKFGALHMEDTRRKMTAVFQTAVDAGGSHKFMSR